MLYSCLFTINGHKWSADANVPSFFGSFLQLKPGLYCKVDILELDSIRIWTLFESGHYCVSKNIVKLQSNFTIQNIDMTVVFTENKGILFLKLILYLYIFHFSYMILFLRPVRTQNSEKL